MKLALLVVFIAFIALIEATPVRNPPAQEAENSSVSVSAATNKLKKLYLKIKNKVRKYVGRVDFSAMKERQLQRLSNLAQSGQEVLTNFQAQLNAYIQSRTSSEP